MGQIDWHARFRRSGGIRLHSTRQLAEALTGREARLTGDSLGGARAFRSDLEYGRGNVPVRSQVPILFGESPKRKVLCSCGAIAEVDQVVAAKKMALGKAMECRSCRNERIAREREELERHFFGEDEEGEEW
jgi:hypothetical protein